MFRKLLCFFSYHERLKIAEKTVWQKGNRLYLVGICPACSDEVPMKYLGNAWRMTRSLEKSKKRVLTKLHQDLIRDGYAIKKSG